ncbi:hypothetical protein [Paraburkholderia aspalathi]|uniref:hypothetical protein n=1 Tax=Paraburkholderia aspalathi TaxID=1324617 RepID=UPI00190A45E1|nr:hypothetical protein [Paraburkholderia aspalathi]MBK3823763.1 hypothetical protein [Paraburkholderia aspalathi]MBK3835623.1 hypothetical protein [Paraburkholderia aspalathi]MBK3865356.1 hypothetical protein [Paraburkholderia aspalathi]
MTLNQVEFTAPSAKLVNVADPDLLYAGNVTATTITMLGTLSHGQFLPKVTGLGNLRFDVPSGVFLSRLNRRDTTHTSVPYSTGKRLRFIRIEDLITFYTSLGNAYKFGGWQRVKMNVVGPETSFTAESSYAGLAGLANISGFLFVDVNPAKSELKEGPDAVVEELAELLRFPVMGGQNYNQRATLLGTLDSNLGQPPNWFPVGLLQTTDERVTVVPLAFAPKLADRNIPTRNFSLLADEFAISTARGWIPSSSAPLPSITQEQIDRAVSGLTDSLIKGGGP